MTKKYYIFESFIIVIVVLFFFYSLCISVWHKDLFTFFLNYSLISIFGIELPYVIFIFIIWGGLLIITIMSLCNAMKKEKYIVLLLLLLGSIISFFITLVLLKDTLNYFINFFKF